jgi:hypothetical protein
MTGRSDAWAVGLFTNGLAATCAKGMVTTVSVVGRPTFVLKIPTPYRAS